MGGEYDAGGQGAPTSAHEAGTLGSGVMCPACAVDERTGAIDLVMDAAHPQVLYAAMWQKPWK
jgi:hypothetical protein